MIRTSFSIMLLVFLAAMPASAQLFDIPRAAETTNPSLRWSAESVVPAHYRGRTLPSVNSGISIVAEGAPPSLDFRWFVNDFRQSASSGAGKTSLRYRIPNSLEQRFISVRLELYNQNNELVGSNSVGIPLQKPRLTIVGENGLGKHIVTNDHSFDVPIAGARFFLYTYFAPFSWLNNGEVLWHVGNETSQSEFNAISFVDLSVQNRGTNDVKTTLTAMAEQLSASALLTIKGAQQPTDL